MYKANELRSNCPHIIVIGDYTKEDIIEKQVSTCDICDNPGPNLWVCLHRDCLHVSCGDTSNSHNIRHFQRQSEHSLILNLTSLQVFCLICNCEVFLENNDPPIPGMLNAQPTTVARSDSDSEEENESSDETIKPRGLTGLQNMGNTCYMNSALQSLSNCPQLTNFFLDCGAFVRSDKKPGLSKSYLRLMKEMWHRKRPSYVVPSGIAFGIKLVCPVFRGYNQQDAQEFLRCFMDQLHEELKEPVIELAGTCSLSVSNTEFDAPRSDSGIPVSEESSQSDGDYETCDDSGPNSEKDSCADEAIDHSDPSQESSDILTSTSTSIQNKNCEFALSNNVHCVLSSHSTTTLKSFSTSDKSCINGNSERKSLISECCLPDSGLANSVSLSCDKNDEPLLKEDCKSSHQKVLFGEDRGFDSNFQNMCVCTISSSSCSNKSKNELALPHQISQSKQSQTNLYSVATIQKKKPVQYRSIISDIFDGKTLSSVQCLTCDTVSFTKETFQDLSLPIPTKEHLNLIHTSQCSHPKSGGTCTDVYSHKGWFSSFVNWMISWFIGPSISLQDCLAAFFSADELKDENMYSCDKCKKLRNGIKYSKVIELPEVLCIHLKRFRHEVMYSSKISSYVTFPLEGLDMAPFLHESYSQEVTTYDLVSVICHHGTAGSGHYTAYSLNHLSEQWYEFDDCYVTAIDTEMVRHCEAYVLFYRRSGEEIIRKRQCAVELLDRSKNENGLLKFFISKQWLNKFNYFSEPGPITNTDFLCVHGGVPPQKASFVNELCTSMPQAVWEYLHDTFGGGPPCTHLYLCSLCHAELDKLNQKRRKELEEFLNMNVEFSQVKNPEVVYAISMSWFKTWETFVCRDGDVPGPIDNNVICYLKNNKPFLKLGSDYCSISKEMYQYLQSIYGGGPDILLHPNTSVVSGPQFYAENTSLCFNKHCAPFSSNNNMHDVQVHTSCKTNKPSHSQKFCSISESTYDDETGATFYKKNGGFHDEADDTDCSHNLMYDH